MTEFNLPDKDDAPWLDCMDGFSKLKNPTLSPAARAILVAYLDADIDDEPSVAAVLRAVAEQLGYSRAPGVEFEELYGLIVDVDDLLAIANELEGKG